MLVDRIINTLVGDRFNRNYEIHIFNSHTLSQLSYSATLKPRVSPTLDWTSSRSHLFLRHHARAQLFSHTSLSFVLSSAMEYLKHSDHTTPLFATLILPYKHHVFSLIYGNHYHTNNLSSFTRLICLQESSTSRTDRSQVSGHDHFKDKVHDSLQQQRTRSTVEERRFKENIHSDSPRGDLTLIGFGSPDLKVASNVESCLESRVTLSPFFHEAPVQVTKRTSGYFNPWRGRSVPAVITDGAKRRASK